MLKKFIKETLKTKRAGNKQLRLLASKIITDASDLEGVHKIIGDKQILSTLDVAVGVSLMLGCVNDATLDFLEGKKSVNTKKLVSAGVMSESQVLLVSSKTSTWDVRTLITVLTLHEDNMPEIGVTLVFLVGLKLHLGKRLHANVWLSNDIKYVDCVDSWAYLDSLNWRNV